jgi:hypothetical protein
VIADYRAMHAYPLKVTMGVRVMIETEIGPNAPRPARTAGGPTTFASTLKLAADRLALEDRGQPADPVLEEEFAP